MAEPVKVGDAVWVTAKSRPEQAQGVVVASDEEGGWALVEHDGVEPGPFGWGWSQLILRDKVQHPIAWSQTVLDKIEETGGQGWTVHYRVVNGIPMKYSIYLSHPGVQGEVWWTVAEDEMPDVTSGSDCGPLLHPYWDEPLLSFRGQQVLGAPDVNSYASTAKKALDLLRSLNGGPAINRGEDQCLS